MFLLLFVTQRIDKRSIFFYLAFALINIYAVVQPEKHYHSMYGRDACTCVPSLHVGFPYSPQPQEILQHNHTWTSKAAGNDKNDEDSTIASLKS